jgi:hypothetical protein
MNCPLCKSDSVYEAKEYGDKGYSNKCERCGAKEINGKWVKICGRCKSEVTELHGLFVPHLCKSCLDIIVENDRRTGNICLLCRQPRSLCCC